MTLTTCTYVTGTVTNHDSPPFRCKKVIKRQQNIFVISEKSILVAFTQTN